MDIPFRLIGHLANLAYETYQTHKMIGDSVMGTPTAAGGKMLIAAYHDSVPSGFHGYDSDAGFGLVAWLERGKYKITDGRTSRVRRDGSVVRLGKWSSSTYDYREDDTLKYKSSLFCVPGDLSGAGFSFLKMEWEKADDPCFAFAHSTGFGEAALLARNGAELPVTLYGEWIGLGVIDDDFRPRMALPGKPYILQLLDRAAQR